eukprot:8004836-Pyramimonas_sp.AAC.1
MSFLIRRRCCCPQLLVAEVGVLLLLTPGLLEVDGAEIESAFCLASVLASRSWMVQEALLPMMSPRRRKVPIVILLAKVLVPSGKVDETSTASIERGPVAFAAAGLIG